MHSTDTNRDRIYPVSKRQGSFRARYDHAKRLVIQVKEQYNIFLITRIENKNVCFV